MAGLSTNPSLLPPPDDRGGAYRGVLIGLGIPSLIVITLRVYVRIKYTKMWWDDYLMLVVVPFLIANHGLSLASIKYGIGQHLLLLNPLDAMEAAKLNTIAQPLNILALFFVKASIVLFLVRLKPGKIYLYTLWATFALLLSITVEAFIVTMAQCQPIARGWNPTITEGFCWSANVFEYSAYILSACTILTDIVYITIPVFFLWNVQLNKKVKYAIWAVLSLGVVSMGCSITAIPFIYQLGKSADPTYTIVDLASIKSGELNVAIICACMPPMQPLFKRTGELISRFTMSGASAGSSRGKTWESRQAHRPANKYAYLDGTTQAGSRNTDMKSQSSAAPLAGAGAGKTWHTSNVSQGSVGGDDYEMGRVQQGTGGIVRTTDVNVSYGVGK